MKRWSSLQRELYKLIDENINFQIHLSKYKMGTMGSTYIPRYWITLDKEIIFDYPKQFLYKDEDGFTYVKNLNGDKLYYPYSNDISDISPSSCGFPSALLFRHHLPHCRLLLFYSDAKVFGLKAWPLRYGRVLFLSSAMIFIEFLNNLWYNQFRNNFIFM